MTWALFDRMRFAARVPPVILQTETGECGLACLAMVANYYGHQLDMVALRRAHAVSVKGLTLAHLVQVSAKLGFVSRPVKTELEDLWRIKKPTILHWNFNHFVVLVRASGNHVTIHDPALGERTLHRAEVSCHYTGICLELTPQASFVPKIDQSRISITDLIGKAGDWRSTVTQILAIAAALEIVSILSPFFIQLVVDQAVASIDRSLVALLSLGFLLLGIVHVVISAARAWMLTALGAALNIALTGRLFAHLLRLPMAFFGKRHLGDIASRFESLSVIQRTLTTSFIEAVVDGVMAVISLVVMFAYSPTLALIVCAAASVYALLRAALYRSMRQAQDQQIVHAAKQQSCFLESVRGIQSIKLFERQPFRNAVFRNYVVDSLNAGVRVQRLEIASQAGNGLTLAVETIAVGWLGALLILDGQFTVGMLFAFIAFRLQFSSRVTALIDKLIEFHMLGLHAERVGDIALTEPEMESGVREAAHLQHADIELRHVSFRYSDIEPYVLRDVSLKISEGESVAIVGPSGCGKTTLLKVILGLLTPCEGEVLIGGVSLQQLGSSHRQLIGTVMQDDDLFAGSLADNISFFDPQMNRERIEACAKLAAIHHDIEQMPMGYDTLVGDMGAALSGGQMQRVLLARALYKQPRILALDEATSHLDVNRERTVNESIRALKLTRVVIAHRPETIRMAGRVIDIGDCNDKAQIQLASAR